jgi:hypothetical protein
MGGVALPMGMGMGMGMGMPVGLTPRPTLNPMAASAQYMRATAMDQFGPSSGARPASAWFY